MKQLINLFVCSLAITCYAQDCTSYYLLQNNKTVEMTLTDKKGRPNAKQVYTVTGLSNAGGTTTAHIKTIMFDAKGKEIATGNNDIKCTGGVMMMNMKMMLPQQQQQAITTSVAAESDFLAYPKNMSVGSSLPDGNFSMDITMNGLKQQVTMVVDNRKVESKESITTPAGTWDSFKINYKIHMNIKTMGIGIPVNMTASEWFVPNFGTVKTQSNYGGSEITAIK